MGRSDKCAVYVSVVAKTSSAMRCSRSNGWVHQACTELEDEALECIKKEDKMFCLFCKECIDDTKAMLRAVDVQKNIIQSVVEQMSDTNCKLEMSVETKSLEDKINATGSIGQESTMRP